MGSIYSIQSYVGKGMTEIESAQDLVRQIGKGIRIEMNTKTVYYKGERHFLFSMRVDNKDYSWESVVL
jgi:hypothetical protein